MKKIFVTTVAALLCAGLGARTFDVLPHVGLDYIFLNSEYARSNNQFDESGTLHAVRLTPSADMVFATKDSVFRHRVSAGVNLRKTMGDGLGLKALYESPVICYGLEVSKRPGRQFSLCVGSIPRDRMQQKYIGPIFSPGAYYDNPTLQGALIQWNAERFRTEISLDWNGLLGDEANPTRREQFQILLSGDWHFAGPLHLRWEGSFHHIACSVEDSNVIDNHLLHPSLAWTPLCGWLDCLDVAAGPIVSYQWDRTIDGGLKTPVGLYLTQRAEKKGFYISNGFYCGADLQPLRGEDYSALMYRGLGQFHTPGSGWADELALGYARSFGSAVSLRLHLVFDFGSKTDLSGIYRGCYQAFSLTVRL